MDESSFEDEACKPHASCVDGSDGAQCTCENGYTEQGGACVDIDECERGTDDCDDDPDACINTDGAFDCSCPAGYTGDAMGRGGCIRMPTDECAEHADNCDHDPDACVDTRDGFECRCPAGYTGDGVSSNGCVAIDACPSRSGQCATFSDIHTTIFMPRCMGCHGAAGNLSLATPSDAYRNLLNVQAMDPRCEGVNRVTPGNAPGSVLVMAIRGEGCRSGRPMPPLAPTLSADDIAKISSWIEAGAKDD